MSEGYTIVNGEKVYGRTLTFDTDGLKVGSEVVVKNNSNNFNNTAIKNTESNDGAVEKTESDNGAIRNTEKVKNQVKVLPFILGFMSGVLFGVLSISLLFDRKEN